MSSPLTNENPLRFETTIHNGSHEYRIEVREAVTGSRYLRLVDIRHARRDEEERRGVLVFEECAPDLCWALTRAMAVLGDPNIIDSTCSDLSEPSSGEHHDMCDSRAYEPWTASEVTRLRLAYEQGQDIRSISAMLKRSENAIDSRLRELGLR